MCVIDIFSKYAWVIPLKDEKGIIITNAFQKILKQTNYKPNKIWLYKTFEFYNISIKLFPKKKKKKKIEGYSTQNDGKSVKGERFIRALKKL